MIAGRHPGQSHAAKGSGGPPLVLLHGFLGSPSSWDAVLASMPHHGPAWCPWLPGHGPASPTPATWDATVQALAAALPAGAVLAGYSLGARLALAAALRHGSHLCGTLLVGGHVGLGKAQARAERAAQDAGRAAALRRGPLEAFIADWEALPLFASQRALPAQRLAQQRAARLAHDPQALAWAFEVAGLAQMPDLRPAVAMARQPLCFLTGALDERFGALAAALVRPPWVTHRQVSGAGHNLLLEAPADVARQIQALALGSPPTHSAKRGSAA
ncbi:MAG: alpha/beta fold hydrolase [Rubrivivax sp.]|nr:alpha/beta fold hydrolase [Rubrivivax sp.]